MINKLSIQNVLNTCADTYLHLFDKYVSSETLKNRQDVVRGYDDWVAGYSKPDCFEDLYVTPEINIEYDYDLEQYIVFGYMNINYNNDIYEIELYDSNHGLYEEYPFEIIGLAGKLFKNHKTIDKLQ